ncbi:MAG: rhomboid family intramembrane serine protease [Saprospiraceae bacterium]|nr:rhomboid family intramembrane serine protease [Candidatus Vicinibacter affinis]
MFFPIGDDQVQGGNKPLFSYSLIFANVLVFFYELSLGSEMSNIFVSQYGAIPSEILGGQDFYTLISCMFLHGGWMHLIGNMLFLWVLLIILRLLLVQLILLFSTYLEVLPHQLFMYFLIHTAKYQ